MSRQGNIPFFTTVDDDLFAELETLTGQSIVYFAVWEDSLADALEGREEAPATETTFDVDLYLDGGVYFELYAVACFLDPDADPLADHDEVVAQLAGLMRQQGQLTEVAVDTEDGLVLVLQSTGGGPLYLVVGAWLLEQWDELPED